MSVLGKWKCSGVFLEFFDDGSYVRYNSNTGLKTVGNYQIYDNILDFKDLKTSFKYSNLGYGLMLTGADNSPTMFSKV